MAIKLMHSLIIILVEHIYNHYICTKHIELKFRVMMRNNLFFFVRNHKTPKHTKDRK